MWELCWGSQNRKANHITVNPLQPLWTCSCVLNLSSIIVCVKPSSLSYYCFLYCPSFEFSFWWVFLFFLITTIRSMQRGFQPAATLTTSPASGYAAYAASPPLSSTHLSSTPLSATPLPAMSTPPANATHPMLSSHEYTSPYAPPPVPVLPGLPTNLRQVEQPPTHPYHSNSRQ